MDRTTKTRRTIESGRLQGKEIEIKWIKKIKNYRKPVRKNKSRLE